MRRREGRAGVIRCGDTAFLCLPGPEEISLAASRRARRLAEDIVAVGLPGVSDVIPGYVGVLVCCGPFPSPRRGPLRPLRRLTLAVSRRGAPGACARGPGRDDAHPTLRPVLSIPVVYGGDRGPDLEQVAREKGLEPAEVVRLHSGTVYEVFCLGFAPGFPFLGELPESLAVRRRPEPRTCVPAGSVGLGGRQTGIYPATGPGGWQIIGWTPLRLFDPDRRPPALLQPGDRVRFQALPPAAAPSGRVTTVRPVSRGTSPKARATLAVRQPGFGVTIQDQGRHGRQHLGVPVGGAVDPVSLALANIVCGNPPGAATLEVPAPGLVLEVLRPVCCAIGGADLEPEACGRTLERWTPYVLPAGTILRFRRRRAGCRAYLAVGGGFGTAPVLGSRSTDLTGGCGGFEGRCLQSGDILPVLPGPSPLSCRRPAMSVVAHIEGILGLRGAARESRPLGVRVLPGPQRHRLTAAAARTFLGSGYLVGTRSDRMGLRLFGPPLELEQGADIISEGVPPGAVQISGNGLPLVMLAARQTIGGYIKPFICISADLARLGQLVPGARIQFRPVGYRAADRARHRVERLLAAVAAGPARDPCQPEQQARRVRSGRPDQSGRPGGATGPVVAGDARRLRFRMGNDAWEATIDQHSDHEEVVPCQK